MSDPVFIVDGMLGNLARWLRILGYDTVYCPLPDNTILEKAYNEGRILLTRDKALFRIAARKGVKSILIDGQDIVDILLSIALSLNITVKPQEKSRCPICNGDLDEAGVNDVKNLVPKNVLSKNSVFWICRNCGKIYWHGSHWKLILSTLSKIDKMIKDFNKAKIHSL
jgi:uncharacterized protein with PIN domain